jgi:hypothetical protein
MKRNEKKCKNPECNALIEYYENPKKLFCDLSCKNRYHYLKDTEENAEIISLNKALRLNYKIIVNFIANDVYKVNADVARALGFQTNVFMDLNNFSICGKRYINLRRLNDVYFVFDKERNVIIIYFFEDYKDVA